MVEQPPHGDRLRAIPPFGDDGKSPQHMGQSWGKRSIALDVRDPGDREIILALARQADIIAWTHARASSLSLNWAKDDRQRGDRGVTASGPGG
jgi:crotonobetainyl-CoA:carnitine CoA-transferase CaiB-like acyl-CoA transferase